MMDLLMVAIATFRKSAEKMHTTMRDITPPEAVL